MKVFLERGTTVTCENGHPICEVAFPLRRYTAPSATDFMNWRGAVPGEHDAIQPCACGAPYIINRLGHGLQIHTAEGWFP